MHNRVDPVVPAARQAGLVVSDIDGQTVVYDLDNHHIHRLNGVSSAIWTALDGNRTVSDVAATATARTGTAIDEAAVQEALHGLSAANLLSGAIASTRTESRRRFTRRAAVAGAVAVPAIVSMSAPHAVAAQSPTCPGGGTPVTNCAGQPQGTCCVKGGSGNLGTCQPNPGGNMTC